MILSYMIQNTYFSCHILSKVKQLFYEPVEKEKILTNYKMALTIRSISISKTLTHENMYILE